MHPLSQLFARVLGILLLLPCGAIGQVSILTQRYDSARDGLNANETTLTLSNVSTATFGKLFGLSTDGRVFAQPLYVPNVSIPGAGVHNVLYVATEHDSVYAFDADGLQLQPLWTVNLATASCPNGWTCNPVPYSMNTEGVNTDIVPEIGITSTPVIDPSTNTIYAVAKTQEISGSTTSYVYRLHALSITTGQEQSNSPIVIQGQVPGTGSPNSGDFLTFSPLYSMQRPGLVLANNAVYIAFGSWGDNDIWHGWIFGYNTSSLAQVAAFSVSPNGGEGEGGIWMHGNGLVADPDGNLYFSSGNGGFDGIADYSDSFLKLATPGLTVVDYFTPFNQAILDTVDLDVAAGGLMILPDAAGTSQHPHILVGCGKNGAIYVIDADNMGHFNSSSDSQIIQELLNVIGGTPVTNNSTAYVENCYGSPAYWQGHIYWGGVSDSVKMFNFTNGLSSTAAVSQSSEVYQFPGASPVVSANGSTQGILWTIENNGSTDQDVSGQTAILHAYDATNLASELYNSSQVASDLAGSPVKFTMPVVANGKVYLGTQSSVAAYGLLGSMTQASTPTFSPAGGTYNGAVSVSISDTTPSTTIYYTTDGSIPTAESSVYNGPIVLTTGTTLSAVAVGAGYRSSPPIAADYVVTGGTSSPAFIQSNYAVPKSQQSTVSVAYLKAQVAGDLNVVIVGWSDRTASIVAGGVTDSAGNTYVQAGPAALSGGATQAIYYAKSIVSAGAGANTITVNFNSPANGVDLRILEYSEIDQSNPFDSVSSAIGEGTNSTVTLTTTNADDVIVGANVVQTLTVGPGAGFTSRILTSPNGDIAEDEAVSAAGSFVVNASVSPSGFWLMQAVAFKTAHVTNPPPIVISISPTSGSTVGGTTVTITGTGFLPGAQVSFGGIAATGIAVLSGTSITATTPAHIAGLVSLLVTNTDGQSGNLSNGYTYVSPNPAPTISGISPNTGPSLGGTPVTITGTGFLAGATVTFGAKLATNVTVVNSTSITATSPSNNPGVVAILVTNTDGQSGSLANGFTYIAAPTVSSVSPSSGPVAGGTAVTITGTNFAVGASVTFGSAAATNVTVVNGTTITATSPAGSAGAVTVTVTNSGGQSGSLNNGFTYTTATAPTVSSVSPRSGPVAGGTAVTITGTNFAAGASVTFGGTAATNVVFVSGTQVTATTPAHAAGGVTVTVTVNGQSGNLANGFTYNGTVVISFAQVASATPQSTTATVALAYPGAQTAGDLNIVVVGWNDTAATVQSVKDSAGNNYSLAIGPTSGTGLRQSIYYAANIVGGANTVTVTFSQGAVAPDIRILEYRGVTTLDVTAGASGSGTAANSGSATTTSANELIFGANMVATLTRAAGSGFTSRIITSPDGDIAEDKIVTTAGSNSATATLNGSGPWVMQMVTFK